MGDGDGSTGGQCGEGTNLSGDPRDVLDLDAIESGRAALRVGDGEGVGRELRQRAVGVVQDSESLITNVGDDGVDLEVVDVLNRGST
jgi:hypothetical protein